MIAGHPTLSFSCFLLPMHTLFLTHDAIYTLSSPQNRRTADSSSNTTRTQKSRPRLLFLSVVFCTVPQGVDTDWTSDRMDAARLPHLRNVSAISNASFLFPSGVSYSYAGCLVTTVYVPHLALLELTSSLSCFHPTFKHALFQVPSSKAKLFVLKVMLNLLSTAGGFHLLRRLRPGSWS